ncbi:hypothetical protein MUP77_03525 [Candidatus Bathyarchaeota archaeon]|nr:hypothetical protein [Candidatus Bathyarchaeota archaeon]
MRISIWEEGHQKDASLEDLKSNFNSSTWINVSDPTINDLEKLAEALDVPRHILIGKMRSNYPHADSYSEYTKIFAWYLDTSSKDPSIDKSPVIVFTNKVSTITISPSKTSIQERIVEAISAKNLTTISLPVLIIYLTMINLLQTYEYFTEEYEKLVEKFEEITPPWSRRFYAEAFVMRKEASRLLRILRHYRMLVEPFAKKRIHVRLTEEELRILDTVYDRAVAAEETTETSLDTIRDLISLHLDTLSHDMDNAMRLLASITVIVAVPSVIGTLLGTNLVGEPWPFELWQIAAISLSIATVLAAYLYRKGWLKLT